MMLHRQPHTRSPAGRALHGTCRRDALVDSCCAERSCRRGLSASVAINCKYCAKTFCSEHAGPGQHGCAAACLVDKRALACERCGELIIAHDALQGLRSFGEKMGVRTFACEDSHDDALPASCMPCEIQRRADTCVFTVFDLT